MVSITREQALLEGAKEFGRVMIFSLIGTGLAVGLAAANLVDNALIQVGLITLVTSLGKAWDKFTHKDPTNNITTGVTGF